MTQPPGDEEPPTLEHMALHLAKDAGLLAQALERMGHARERKEGWTLLDDWIRKRPDNVRKHVDRILERYALDCIYEGRTPVVNILPALNMPMEPGKTKCCACGKPVAPGHPDNTQCGDCFDRDMHRGRD